jgi:hypothetical protein
LTVPERTPRKRDGELRLSPDQAEALEQYAERIDSALDFMRLTVLERSIAVGRELLAVHALLAKRDSWNGMFSIWCRNRLRISNAAVYVYMNAAKFADAHPELIERFDISALRRLQNPKHAAAFDEAIDLARGGEKITQALAWEIIGRNRLSYPTGHVGRRPGASSRLKQLQREQAASNFPGDLSAKTAAGGPRDDDDSDDVGDEDGACGSSDNGAADEYARRVAQLRWKAPVDLSCLPNQLRDQLEDVLQRLRFIKQSCPARDRGTVSAAIAGVLAESWEG